MDEVLAVADTPAALLMLDALDGKELVRIPTGASFRARFKYPYVIVHRIDLHNVLLDACRKSAAIELVPQAMVTGFEDGGDNVSVSTADGRTLTGAALIAADGLRSLFRQTLIGDGEPHPVGYAALRTIVPMGELKVDVPRDCVVLWGGPGYHVVHYPLRHGAEFNIVAVFRTTTHAEKADAATYRAELEQTYRSAHPSMRELNAMMDLRWRRSVADRTPVRHWHKGNTVLLGDAAHAPLQSLAQGACMAIEDGHCLAETTHVAERDFAAAFRRYEALRLTRTRACSSNPARCGNRFIMSTALRGMCAMPPSPHGMKRIYLTVWRGSTTVPEREITSAANPKFARPRRAPMRTSASKAALQSDTC